MGFLSDVWRDVKGAVDSVGDAVGSVWHGATGTPSASDRRATKRAMQSQVDYYRQQTELEQSEISRKRDEQLVEKRRIEEKQIRSLRRNFKPAGFLDSDSGTADASDKLGG